MGLKILAALPPWPTLNLIAKVVAGHTEVGKVHCDFGNPF
jgi:hypothetical protein